MMTSVSRQTETTLSALLQGFVADKKLPDLEITGLTSNSANIKKGELFVALAGLRNHAIDYAAAAVKSGAVAVIYDANDTYSLQRIALLQKQFDVDFIAVKNLKQKLGKISSRYYAYPSRNFTLIGVTGTDGKTSVTHLLIQILAKLNKKAGSVGTLGYGLSNRLKMTNFTTPDAITLQSILFELSLGSCEYVVMEVSSHALEQYRDSGCQFDLAVLTNLGSDHLDYHGDLKHYREAKKRLFDKQNLSARILNMDDDFGFSMDKEFKSDKVIGYSVNSDIGTEASVKLMSTMITNQGISIVVSTTVGTVSVQSGLIGSFNINNLLCCIAVLVQLGFDQQQIEESMQGLQTIPGRMEYFPAIFKQPAVVIDFAHTEQALSACLKALKDFCEGKLICIFGCGGDRDQSKRPKMAAVAEQLADQVIVTDDNPRNEPPEQIMRDILVGFINPQQVRIIHDRETAIESALAEAGEKDLVIVAGKGHEKFQIINGKRIPYSDHFIVKDIRKRAIQ